MCQLCLLNCLASHRGIGETLRQVQLCLDAKHYYLVRYHPVNTVNGDAKHQQHQIKQQENCFVVSSDVDTIDDSTFQSKINDIQDESLVTLEINADTVLYLVMEKGGAVSLNPLLKTVIAKIVDHDEYDIPFLLRRTQHFSEEEYQKQISRSFSVISLNKDLLFEHLVSLFYRSKIFSGLEIDFNDLVSFFVEIRRRYNQAPYHNWVHAVDVTQFVATIIENVGITDYIEAYEAFAVLFAAICHDIEHTGHNNAFHRKATTIFATLARSALPPLESHHAELAIQILHEKHRQIFSRLSEKQEKIEHIIVDCILATDMEKHSEFVNNFKSIMKKYNRNNEEHHLLLCQIILKAADLSNTVRDFDEAVKMTNQLMTEFFMQGDLESKLGIEISPMCDRKTADPISKGQIGFYRFVAEPLMGSLNNFFGNLEENEKQFNNNLMQWESMQDNSVEPQH